jgi:predicted dehydrogenase
MANIECAARAGFQIAAVCDVDPPALERARATALRLGFAAGAHRNFREILASQSIDAVSIATPAHCHAPMTIEACQAGKDVWCETPACMYLEEGPQVVDAARKYQRVVQAGTIQRSGGALQNARQIVHSGQLGDVNFCSAFRTASPGQPMTEQGIELIDMLQFAFDEAMPVSVSVQSAGFMLATYRYPGFLGAYESRATNPTALSQETEGIAFHGSRATLRVRQTSHTLAEPRVAHWRNFLNSMRTRRRPVSDIETCVRSTITCLLSNLALRHGATLAWDEQALTVKYRSP